MAATDNYEMAVDLEAEADEMVTDDAPVDETDRIKMNATKKKGRGFTNSREDDGSRPITGAKFDTLEDAQTGGSAQRSVEGWIILITGVHEEASEEDVSERCAEYGTVKNLHLNLDRQTGYIKGYALVEYETYQQAKAAIDSLNNSTLLEQPIKADFAFVNGPGGSKSVQESRKHRSSVDRRGSR